MSRAEIILPPHSPPPLAVACQTGKWNERSLPGANFISWAEICAPSALRDGRTFHREVESSEGGFRQRHRVPWWSGRTQLSPPPQVAPAVSGESTVSQQSWTCATWSPGPREPITTSYQYRGSPGMRHSAIPRCTGISQAAIFDSVDAADVESALGQSVRSARRHETVCVGSVEVRGRAESLPNRNPCASHPSASGRRQNAACRRWEVFTPGDHTSDVHRIRPWARCSRSRD